MLRPYLCPEAAIHAAATLLATAGRKEIPLSQNDQEHHRSEPIATPRRA